MNKSEKFWDKQASSFDPQGGDYGETFYKSLELTKKHLRTDAVVLDYGCGTGTMAIEIAHLVHSVDGIDISSKMLDVAKRKVNEQTIENVRFTQADIFDMHYQPHSFDVVLAFNILHLLEDVPTAIDTINNLLKAGGLFISATACLGEKRGGVSVFCHS